MENTYETKNLHLAAFLCSSNLPLIRTRKTHNGVYFEFSPKDKAEELISEYFSDKATVNPKTLFSKLNDLKDLIFSGGAI